MVHVLVTLLKVALVETAGGWIGEKLDGSIMEAPCGVWFDGGPTGNSIGSIDVKI